MTTFKIPLVSGLSALVVALGLTALPATQAEAASNNRLQLALSAQNPQSTGLGIAVTWNSKRLVLQDIAHLFPQDLMVTDPTAEADTQDIDHDPATDRMLRLAWMSIDGRWQPGQATLAVLNFSQQGKQQATPAFHLTRISGRGKVRVRTGKPKAPGNTPGAFEVLGFDRKTEKNSSAIRRLNPFGHSTTLHAMDAPTTSNSAMNAPAAASLVDIEKGFCSPDIDESAAVDALTDGLLVIRHLFGFSGNALTQDAIASNALIKSAAGVTAKMDQSGCKSYLDVDGNGTLDALTDGLLFIRWAFGFSGDALIQDAVGSGATRTTAAQITTHLASQPVLPPQTAARFLTQASFGPTSDSIAALSATSGGIRAWLDAQLNLPFNPQLPRVQDLTRKMCYYPDYADTWFSPARHHIWWEDAVTGEDQLRQRMAFALSQILVVSDHAPGVDGMQFGLASYYDLLLQHAFGNYRDLLEAVTLHPVMGTYLSMVRNEKADPANNIRPDENYAREVMQLFSLGVYLLNPDGTPQLDGQGQPIPTYGQGDIEQLARVLTGWNYPGLEYWRQWPGEGQTTVPMEYMNATTGADYTEYHDFGEKTLLGQTIPANLSPDQDLDAALDIIFNHPNVAPFISKLLIQRLVTSNPSPAYVGRVAAVFNDNGNGVKGDLGAVVKAILTDEEARVGHLLDDHFGKLREPLLRFTHYWRAFDAQPISLSGKFWDSGTACDDGSGPDPYTYYRVWWGLYDFDDYVGQQVLGANSVFNFYLPDYSPPGIVRDNDLVAPEFQLATENFVVNTAHALNSQIQEQSWDNWPWTVLDLRTEAALANDYDALLDHLNLLLLNGQMKDDLRQILIDHLTQDADENTFDYVAGDDPALARARDAAMLISVSPDYLIQR